MQYFQGGEGHQHPHVYPERVYFLHIRKTGGTSINHMFLSLDQCDSLALYQALGKEYWAECNGRKYAGWNKEVISKGLYNYAFSHHPLHSLMLPEDTFVFTCFRDPQARVVSLYNMLMTLKAENSDHPGMVEQGPWLGDSFDDFLNRAPIREISNQLYMFSARMDVCEAVMQTRRLAYYFFTDSFNAGISNLNQKLGLNLQPTHLRKADHQFEIPPESMLRLKKMLADEYRFLDILRKEHSFRFAEELFSEQKKN